jgi:hypothetical protein
MAAHKPIKGCPDTMAGTAEWRFEDHRLRLLRCRIIFPPAFDVHQRGRNARFLALQAYEAVRLRTPTLFHRHRSFTC